MKFSTRDLLLVTAIVALVVGWWVDRQAREARVKQLEKALSEVTLYGAPIATKFAPRRRSRKPNLP